MSSLTCPQYSIRIILRMISVPVTCRTIAAMISCMPSCDAGQRCPMWSGLIDEQHRASAGGTPTSTQPVMRPCAEMTRIWRLTRKRSRMTVAMLSRTSDRLPPDSRWMSTAVTKKRASSSGTRSRKFLQRVGERHAVVLLVVEQLELGADRRGHFLGDHRQAGGERVAGLERARDADRALRETAPRISASAWCA